MDLDKNQLANSFRREKGFPIFSLELHFLTLAEDNGCHLSSSRYAAELTERWKTLSCNHEVSIILFGRNYITGAPAPCTPDDFSPELRPSLMQVWSGLVRSLVRSLAAW
jgi:hypothetical protein